MPEANKELSSHLLHRDDYIWDERDEPHLRRKVAILEKYPQVKELFGSDPNTKYFCFMIVALQLLTCYMIKDSTSWLSYLFVAYAIGGTLNHSCTSAIHETTHCVVFESQMANYLMAIFVNLPLGVPAAMSFKKYHHEHHQYQGVDGLDTDIGTWFEANYIQSTIAKLFNVIFMSFFYSLRALFVRPKPPTAWELVNMAIQVVFNVSVVYFWGWSALLYFLLSTFLGLGLHPLTGHFIQEHYVTSSDNQETYSYYGLANLLLLNVGYHNEHHDFPRIPGSRLPMLKKIAPEFYENLEYKKSYIYTIYEYIFTNGYGTYDRVKRTKKSHDQGRRAVFHKSKVTGHDCTNGTDVVPSGDVSNANPAEQQTKKDL